MSYPLYHPNSTTASPMLLAPEELAREFSGEGNLVEFKEGISDRKIREAAVAFSNTDGGVILIGVRNDGSIRGVPDPGETERRLRDALDGVHNPGRFAVHHVQVDDHIVLAVGVDRRREGFSQMPDGAIKVRRGARNETLIGPDLTRFQRSRSFERFEDTTTEVRLDAVAAERMEAVATTYGLDPATLERWMIERGLAELRDGTVKLTVAGVMILADAHAQTIGRTGVEVLRFTGTESEPDKRTLISGSVDDVVRNTTDAVLAELGNQNVLLGVTRVEIPRLPVTAVREAVANAVAHRSYEATGTHSRVEIRPGSVRIISPGSLPEPVTVEHMRTQQAARNPKILEFLRRNGLAEDLGLGVDRIEDEMQLELLEPPLFEESAQTVSVTLYTRGSVSPEERGWVRRLMGDNLIEPRDAVVVLQAVREEYVTNSSVREALGIDSTEVRTILQRLRDQGVLMQEGERGGAQYFPAPLLGMPQPTATSIEGRAEAVMALVWERANTTGKQVTNTDVRDLLGVDRPDALRVLNWLVERGTLRREGERRGTSYVLADPSALRLFDD